MLIYTLKLNLCVRVHEEINFNNNYLVSEKNIQNALLKIFDVEYIFVTQIWLGEWFGHSCCVCLTFNAY